MDKKLQIFIDCIFYFFGHNSKIPPEIGSPYLVDSINEVDADYTGLITISGNYTGVCCFTTPKPLLQKLIQTLGVTDISEGMMIDTAGEIANTLSGNAREGLGAGFIISVPKVVEGKPDKSFFPKNAKVYAIPFKWQGHKATLGISLVQ